MIDFCPLIKVLRRTFISHFFFFCTELKLYVLHRWLNIFLRCSLPVHNYKLHDRVCLNSLLFTFLPFFFWSQKNQANDQNKKKSLPSVLSRLINLGIFWLNFWHRHTSSATFRGSIGRNYMLSKLLQSIKLYSFSSWKIRFTGLVIE